MDQYRPTGFRILPPVVKNLIIINALFYLGTIAASQTFHIDLADYLGLHYPVSSLFKPHQLVTYMFMHGSPAHILFNMFAVWMFGNALENVWGPKRFLIYYLITGIGAAIVHYVVFYFQISPVIHALDGFLNNPNNAALQSLFNNGYVNLSRGHDEINNLVNDFLPQYNALVKTDPGKAMQLATEFIVNYRTAFLNAPVVVGASGAVFGILLAFGMMFPNMMIMIYFLFPMKAKHLVILYGAFELYAGLANHAGDNVAHFAHLGGMLFGWLLIKKWGVRSIH